MIELYVFREIGMACEIRLIRDYMMCGYIMRKTAFKLISTWQKKGIRFLCFNKIALLKLDIKFSYLQP